MTSLEHVSVEPVTHRTPSRAGEGNVINVLGGLESEEADVGVAVTTADEEEEETGKTQCTVVSSVNVNVNTNGDEEEEEAREAVRSGSSTMRSRSRSRSASHSRSPSSRGIDVGESSAATSWTQVEEEQPCGDDRGLSEEGRSTDDRLTRVEVERDRGVSSSRTGVVDVKGAEAPRKEEVLVMQEEDIGEGWHPLRYDGKARLQDDEKAEGEGEGDVESDGEERGMEMDEKERWRTFGSSGRNSRQLRLAFKPSSPQPWEDVDPPADNNGTFGSSDYYSTLNSKKFGILQKSRQRPLIPHSTYYFGPPPPGSAYGSPPVGQLGVHHPREIVRVERDYAGGELVQFSPVFPLELEGRITPTQFHQTINDVNEILISAHSIQHSFIDNFLAIITLQLSTLVTTSHYTKEMRRLKRKIEQQNTQLYNPAGLNILWPRQVAFLFLEIEYY